MRRRLKMAPKNPKSIGERLESIRSHRWTSCDHEADIADEVVGEVLVILREFGLIDLEKNEEDTDDGSCGYCGGREVQLLHKPYCTRREL